MARLGYVDPTPERPDLEALAAQIRTERGRLPNLYRMLLNSPSVAAGWLHLGTGIRQQAKLNGRLRELVICQIGRLNRADYEWNAHAQLALREGASQAQLDALPHWRESDAFDAQERDVLAYAEMMTNQIEVDDLVFASVRRHFDDQELVELTATVGFYNLVSRFLVALQVDVERPRG
jgi:alkylhydroperoxidase family enzyme